MLRHPFGSQDEIVKLGIKDSSVLNPPKRTEKTGTWYKLIRNFIRRASRQERILDNNKQARALDMIDCPLQTHIAY